MKAASKSAATPTPNVFCYAVNRSSPHIAMNTLVLLRRLTARPRATTSVCGFGHEQRRRAAPASSRPSQTQLVFRRHPETGEPLESHLRWGFIRHGSSTRPAVQPIHARDETIADKPIFADAFRRRRCIVPMNSFYQKDSNVRRHVILRRDFALFPLAGIWDNWLNPHFIGLCDRKAWSYFLYCVSDILRHPPIR